MELIIRADDFGITESVTCGIMMGFKDGIITCTGLMTNMPSSIEACRQAKDHPEYCFGQDINIATGQCVADPKKLPTMVDENGYFRRSPIIRGLIKEGKEPFPYEEVRLEVESQLQKFIQLVGRKPAYLNGHAFRSPNFSQALRDVAKEYNLVCMDEVVKTYDLTSKGFKQGWYPLQSGLEAQLNTDTEAYFIEHFEELLAHEYAYLICHPGYVDIELMECSSFNLVRIMDLKMCLSPKVRELIEKHQISLVSITQFLQKHS